MKKGFLIAAVMLLVLGVLIVWQSQKRTIQSEPKDSGDTMGNGDVSQELNTSKAPSTTPREKRQGAGSVPAEVQEYVRHTMEDQYYDWKQPINFYGRVLDESNQPIEGAVIDFKWTDLSSNGTSELHTTSDSSGYFSLEGKTGKRLSVTASKSGYYSSGDARLASFEYANPSEGLFHPDSNNPIIFHLRKKGAGADLISSQSGVKPYFGVTVPLDGTRVSVNLLERKTGSGSLQISQIKPPYKTWKEATEWSFRMEFSDGGFISDAEEFHFEAPESGYQQAIEFKFRKDGPEWTESIRTNFYIKFGNPPRYGFLHLETAIEMEGARLTYAINPSGSRVLEAKENAPGTPPE